MYKIDFYQTARGDQPVREFLKQLDKKTRGKIGSDLWQLQILGPNLQRPHADVIRGKLRELRIHIGDGNIRILYFFFAGDSIILLHAFLKKTNAIRARDVEIAEKRMADWTRSHIN